jgi:hypothetical protein
LNTIGFSEYLKIDILDEQYFLLPRGALRCSPNTIQVFGSISVASLGAVPHLDNNL